VKFVENHEVVGVIETIPQSDNCRWHWKCLHHVAVAVLCGQLLCFFRDRDDFLASKATTSPIIVFKARCEKAEDYTKRKHVFRWDNCPPCLPTYKVRCRPSISGSEEPGSTPL
jgi:hypothetical protein